MSARRGRPSLSPDEQSADVHFRLPESEYRQIEAQARKDRAQVSDVFRRAVRNFVAENRQRSS